jgi:hypothetical protein
LHTPTLGQLKSGKVVDNNKIMDRCEKAFQLITQIMNSPIWKINFGNFTELPECMNSNCKMPVRKRILPGSNVVHAECFECKTEYKIVIGEGNQVLWEPILEPVSCSNLKCNYKIHIPTKSKERGASWICPECARHNILVMSVTEKI